MRFCIGLALDWWLVTLAAFAYSGEAPPTATANDQESVFVTATVWERLVSTATSSVSILTSEDIEQQDAQTLGDLLPFLPGVTLVSQGSRGGLSTALIRGGDPNFTLVLLDGVPLNDPSYQQGDVFDLSGLSLQGIERIEVVRGPLSSFYGSSGLSGVIHLISAKGLRKPLSATLSAGEGDHVAVQTGYSGTVGNGNHAWSLGYQEEDALIAEESFQQLSLNGKLHLPLDGQRLLSMQARYSDWQSSDYADASGGPLFGSGQLRDSDHREYSLSASYQFGATMPHKLEAGVYRHQLERSSPAIFPSVPPSEEDTRFTTTRLSWQTRLWQGKAWQVDAGVDQVWEQVHNQSLLLLPADFGGAQSGDYNESRSRTGAFVALTYTRHAWVLELMTRFDVLQDVDPEWNPRLGVRFDPPDSNWGWHASAGRAFKLPSFFAMASPRTLGGNPDLEPESSVGADLGVFYQRNNFEIEVTAFHNRMKNLVDFDFATFLHINRSEVEAQGIEFTTSFLILDQVHVRLNATRQDVDDSNSNAPLRHRPDWLGGLRIAWQPSSDLSLSLDASSRDQFYDQQIPVTDRFTVSGHTLWGFTGSWQLLEDWQIRLRLDNLTDKDYETLIGYPGAGRSYRVSLRFAQ